MSVRQRIGRRQDVSLRHHWVSLHPLLPLGVPRYGDPRGDLEDCPGHPHVAFGSRDLLGSCHVLLRLRRRLITHHYCLWLNDCKGSEMPN